MYVRACVCAHTGMCVCTFPFNEKGAYETTVIDIKPMRMFNHLIIWLSCARD